MNESSRQYLPAQLRGIAPVLVVNSDGSFSALDLPGAFQDSTAIVANTGRGTWTRVSDEGRDELRLKFDGDFGVPLELSNLWGAPSLTYFLGDPDQGRRIELRKQVG